MARLAPHIVKVQNSKEPRHRRPSVGPVYRSAIVKDRFPAPVDGLETCADPFRKKVDAETMQYFAEISSLLGMGGSVTDPEDRATLCANALEEAQGKELELACDRSCSRVLEMLVLSCDVIHVASFLHRISSGFASIANDASGSHVAEACLKSAAAALNDYNVESAWCRTLKQALSEICQVVGERAVDMMSSCYGSHVVRRLLSLFSGAMLETSSDKRLGRISSGLAGRLVGSPFRTNIEKLAKHESTAFPDLLDSLVWKLLKGAKKNIAELRVDPFAGPVLQAILKTLEGNTEEITKVTRIILDCDSEDLAKEGNILGGVPTEKVKELMFDSSSSHLVEVMLEVAPDALYMEMFQRFFCRNLLELSLHRSANFVVQALIASARHQGQVNMIFEELGTSFSKLIKEVRSGVIASLLTACGRFCTHQREACQSLAHAINPESASVACLLPRVLFLETYARSGHVADWTPAFGKKMSVLGCAMLQTIFSYSKECNQQFWSSLAAMKASHILETAKDAGGCHVVESFLSSSAPLKHKNRVISKLKGHFAELALCLRSSFTVEKCFSIGNIGLKEAITSELATVQADLAKTKHGPHLLKKCDVMGYARLPHQWRLKLSSKQGTLRAFSEMFNPSTKFERQDNLQNSTNGQNDANESESLATNKLGDKLNKKVVSTNSVIGSKSARHGSKRKRKSVESMEILTGMGNELVMGYKEEPFPEEERGRSSLVNAVALSKKRAKLEKLRKKAKSVQHRTSQGL